MIINVPFIDQSTLIRAISEIKKSIRITHTK